MIFEFKLLLLFVASFVAGFVDSIAGGGGLITVPALLAVGLPPQIALGTNKLQASFGSASAMLHFIRAGKVKLSECQTGIIYTAIGAASGVFAVQIIEPSILKKIIPYLLSAIAIYTLFSPKLGIKEHKAKISTSLFYLIFGTVIGFYDGFLGPGTGSFWFIAFVLMLGLSIVEATAHTKVMNFTSNFVALIFFLVAGSVHFREGIIMGIGQFAGAQIGAKLVIKNGASIVRPIFILMVFALIAKLLWHG